MPFITFEGIDGSGKTLQSELLVGFLRNRGVSSILTKEPGGTKFGEWVKSGIFEKNVCPKACLFLFLADRAQHVEEVIKPALSKGVWVVCDRFSDSTISYQSFGFGLDLDIVMRMNDFSTGGIEPDITFILDVPVEVAKKRIEGRSKMCGFDDKSYSFMERVREGFLHVHEMFPERTVIVDGTLPPDGVHRRIVNILLGRFGGIL